MRDVFEYLVLARWIDALARDLGLSVLEPTTSSDRPKGF